MLCECQSGQRTLAILAENLTDRFPELEDFAPGDNWEVVRELDAVQVKVGPDQPWRSLADVVNFLRTLLDEDRLHALRGSWVPGCGSFADGVRELTGPAPLVEMAPRDLTPLLDILEHRRVHTWFQPIFRAGSFDLWGYECLMRGEDEHGNTVYPNDLLKWANQERLTFMLDRVCRETHIENAGRAGLPDNTAVLINFMPTAIYEPGFCLRTTEAAAKRSGIDSSRIIFEVVESEEIADREHLTSILGHYRRNGFRVALDDVGAGYAGLMLLADLNPDLIKIDRELIQKAPDSKMHRTICSALATMGRDSGKLVLAEGVETAEEHAVMDRIGVDLYQGYRFGKPGPVPATRALHLDEETAIAG